MKRVANTLVVSIAVLALLLGLTATLARTKFASAVPGLRGAIPLVVLSGSMEPEIPVGSILFVREVDASAVRTGDVITFRTPGQETLLTTHRVAEVVAQQGGRSFMTKGDANNAVDQKPVPSSNLVGAEVAHVPYLGRLSIFARTRFGFVLLVILPALALVFGEIRGVVRDVRTARRLDPALDSGAHRT